MVESHDHTLGFTIALSSATMTCNDPTPHYPTGCALLNNYDENNDGTITFGEVFIAGVDRDDGKITEEEYQLVADAYNAGSINAVCPGCYTAQAVTCDSGGCALLNKYDTNNDGVFQYGEVFIAGVDRGDGKITEEEYQFICAANDAGSINAVCPGCYTQATPAKGELRDLSYPASAVHGATILVEYKVYNTGQSTGTFKVVLYMGTTIVAQSPTWQQQGNSGTSTKMLTAAVPTTGTSVECNIRCTRII